MRTSAPPPPDDPRDPVTERLGLRLQGLRRELGLTLEDLAEKTGISRATLSRIERGDTSPTAALLGRLAPALGRPMSQLLADVETLPATQIARADQPVWTDPETGFSRRMVSPPAHGFAAELIECELPPGATIAYDSAPVIGLEQHVWMLSGSLTLAYDGTPHALAPGDCLRFRLSGAPTRFVAGPDAPARYLIALARS